MRIILSLFFILKYASYVGLKKIWAILTYFLIQIMEYLFHCTILPQRRPHFAINLRTPIKMRSVSSHISVPTTHQYQPLFIWFPPDHSHFCCWTACQQKTFAFVLFCGPQWTKHHSSNHCRWSSLGIKLLLIFYNHSYQLIYMCLCEN